MTRRQLLVNLFFILIVLLRYNSSTTKLTLLKCTIKWIFVQYLWSYATVTVGHIYHPKKNLYTYQQSLPWSPPLAPWEPLIYFLYLQNWLFWTFCIGGIIHYVFFVWLGCQHNVFEVHPCCSMYQDFISFDCQIIVHCIYRPHFIFSSADWHFGFFPLFGYYE